MHPLSCGRLRNFSPSSSPGRSPMRYDSSTGNALIEEHMHGFKVNFNKKSKVLSFLSKLLQNDHEARSKFKEISEDAKCYAIGNKDLAALFVHTPTSELKSGIRAWLVKNFEFLSVTEGDGIPRTDGKLELLSTAIVDGWMTGLGTALAPDTDALGQLLSEYSKQVYASHLRCLKESAGTLAKRKANKAVQVANLRSELESVDSKRREILQQLRNDTSLLRLDEGSVPIRHPSNAAADARLASLIRLDGYRETI
ncbi:hypothetical protein MKW98_023714 [Papaver atlanticum]|uniref:Uncharacterized protein n=1 Tax=Papaver atlanticum TaxID=357466 RepID=A0AAD4SX75_9MAGN|nr:hypothetical protein MKW98_023714 [Papaver atlanticum]